jgi:hypothetical protein
MVPIAFVSAISEIGSQPQSPLLCWSDDYHSHAGGCFSKTFIALRKRHPRLFSARPDVLVGFLGTAMERD